jgi:ElaB/YqjD/DUF883 family membrane-anchored ribosome-binding protein
MPQNHHPKETAYVADFSKHTSQLRRKAAELGEDVESLGKISKEMAGDAMDFISENANGYYKEGLQKAKHMTKGVEEKIRKNPLQALLIAAGVGAVLGAIWKRR